MQRSFVVCWEKADMIDAPYPADLEAKGWNLDLDYEKIEQSDTWAVASAEQRPWLLMLWLMAWRQVPVASLPNNDRLIAARIGMPLEQFTAWKDVLLSGWELANDGRLYHRTLTQHVLRMAEKRSKDRARVAAYRDKLTPQNSGNELREQRNDAHEQDRGEDASSNDGVTRYTDVSNDDVARDQRVSSTPTPTPTVKPKPANAGSSANMPTGTQESPGSENIANVPHAEVIAAYNEILATQGLTAVKPSLWSGSERAKALRSRWREDPKRQSVDWWRRFFGYVGESDFLMGRAKTDRPWSADLGWLLKRENFVKVCEGKYHA